MNAKQSSAGIEFRFLGGNIGYWLMFGAYTVLMIWVIWASRTPTTEGPVVVEVGIFAGIVFSLIYLIATTRISLEIS